jgi:septal ring factor EnvC (AmiA/AmiB activator)
LFRMEPHAMARSDKDHQEAPEYRSPWRVLARFFEKSRDLWKAKYQGLQERIKEFRTEVRDLRRSRDRWRARAEALEKKVEVLRAQSQERVAQSPPAPSRRSQPVPTQLLS